MDAIKALKADFNEATKDSNFKEKDLILSQECERLVYKGMENLYIS